MADARTGLLTGKGKKEARKDKKEDKKEDKKAEKKTKADTKKFLGEIKSSGKKTVKKMDRVVKKDTKAQRDLLVQFKKVKGQHMLKMANETKPVMVEVHKESLEKARKQARQAAGERKKPMPKGVASAKVFERTGGREFEPRHFVKGYDVDHKQKGTTVHVSKDTKAHTEATKYKAYHRYPVD